ncbi:guanitoxin biosynthesis heme-dependent pre-guanitoxin N-hydroxylase GntA [Mariniflexile ostreae]|uniref:Guanitoxin biosynthesis heme-dependent pre-guanitoxin N-hydroxylase GntA n=1 Tax=Mariniflexile ostreae TaxID=1520892 RepID=A0ABV5FAN3_9FLAO
MNMKSIKAPPAMDSIKAEYKDFILKKKHPCVMAKTVFLTDNYHLKIYDSIKKEESLHALLEDLETFLNHYDFDSNAFESFIAVFPNSFFDSEIQFEKALWNTLQKLHELDDCEWAQTVSDNPNDPDFSFSIKGEPFYIVGLHPNSSRLARQSPYPTIVFNLHFQFEKLRDMGAYEKVKKRIRLRDKKLQGHINPVLRDFGKETEAKQYSGRQVENDWKCPFHKKQN